MPIARQALAHESRDIRLIGMRLTNLVSNTAGARQAAIRFRLLERISVSDYDNDECELRTTFDVAMAPAVVLWEGRKERGTRGISSLTKF